MVGHVEGTLAVGNVVGKYVAQDLVRAACHSFNGSTVFLQQPTMLAFAMTSQKFAHIITGAILTRVSYHSNASVPIYA